MLRRFLMLLLALLLLPACASQLPVGTTAAGSPDVGTVASASKPAATPLVSATTIKKPGCSVASFQPTAGPTEQSLFPTSQEGDQVIGPDTALATIIEYGDFQCPNCAKLAPVLAQLHKDFPKDLRLIFRYYPLIGTPEIPFHDKAALSAQAAAAAGKQEMFWEMHDFLFEKQDEWASLTVSQFLDWLSKAADTLKLDKARFEKDLVDPANVAMIQKAWDEGSSTGIPGTPFLIVNGQIWSTNIPKDYSTISAIIKVYLLEKRQFTSCPDMTIDLTKRYTATLHTSKGDIVLDLYADKAPLAVNNFIFLARQGWYDGVMFFRVLPGFVAQTGDPTDSGMGNPGYAFDNEIESDLKFDKEGVLAMANGGPGTNGSQFFITYAAVDRLDGQFTIFGQVISGMDVAEKMTPRDPSQGGDLPAGDIIQTVTIMEK